MILGFDNNDIFKITNKLQDDVIFIQSDGKITNNSFENESQKLSFLKSKETFAKSF